MKRFTQYLTVFLLMGVLFSACQKDFEKYGKISISKWNPRLSVPFAKTTITFRDIIGNDSNIIANSDSSLVYVYHEDSVISMSADSLMQFSPELSQQYTFSLGALQFDDFSDSSHLSINDVLPYIDPATADTLRNHDQSRNIFPPFRLNSSFSIDMPVIDNYEHLTFSQGTLHIKATNHLPITIDTIYYDLIDIANGQIIASVEDYNLPSGTTQSTSINLAGKTLGNRLRIQARAFSSQGSYPDSVFINLSKGITFTFKTNSLQVISGAAILPEQIAFSESKILDLTLNHGERLYNIAISHGLLNYSIQSGFQIGINAQLSLPSAMQNNSIPEQNISIPAGGNLSQNWDLSGAKLDLTSDNSHKYNRLPVHFSVTLAPTNQMVVFDSSNKVTATFQINGIRLASAKGYFGKQSYQLEDNGISFNLDFLNKLKGSLAFTHPEIVFHYRNDFGIPIKAKFYLKAMKTETGASQNLNFDSVSFKYPKVEGQTVYGSIDINKDNSSIVDFLSLLPDTISFHGGYITNSSGIETNFIDQEAKFSASADIRIPFSFKSSGVEYTDTVTDFHINPDDIPADSGTLVAAISNGLPFNVSVQLAFPDSITGVTLRTLDLGTISSATVNSSGTGNTPTASVLKIVIPGGFFDDVQKANSMIVHLSVSTYNKGTVPVQVFADDKVTIALSVQAALNP